MTIALSPIATPTTQDALARFESLIGVSLPADYKEAVLAQNGGHLGGRATFPVRGLSNNSRVPLATLYSLEGDISTGELISTFERLNGRIPKRVIAIGEDPFGAKLCLDLRSGCRVVFWDNRHFWGTGEWRETDLYYVTPDFKAFLRSLEPSEA